MKVTALLVLISLTLQNAFAQSDANPSEDESRPVSNYAKREAISNYITMLEKAYTCELTVNSVLEMTESMLVSIIGRGGSCKGAIDSLKKKFEPMGVSIDAKIVDPNPSGLKQLDDRIDLINQDLIHETNPDNGT